MGPFVQRFQRGVTYRNSSSFPEFIIKIRCSIGRVYSKKPVNLPATFDKNTNISRQTAAH